MALLEARGISKHFGAIQALEDVSFSVEPGQALGLMGDNGAGKSTLVKIMAGNFPPSGGELTLDGEDVADPIYTGLDVCTPENIDSCLSG